MGATRGCVGVSHFQTESCIGANAGKKTWGAALGLRHPAAPRSARPGEGFAHDRLRHAIGPGRFRASRRDGELTTEGGALAACGP